MLVITLWFIPLYILYVSIDATDYNMKGNASKFNRDF